MTEHIGVSESNLHLRARRSQDYWLHDGAGQRRSSDAMNGRVGKI